MARVPKPRFKEIESLTHDEARRRNIPKAEMQSLYEREAAAKTVTLSYPRATPLSPGQRRKRNADLDPQLVWRGKDEQDWSDLVVHAPPLYIQEKIHPKVIIEDLRREAQRRRDKADEAPDLFADFNRLPDTEARLEFYQHDQNWSNRMILGDSLQVMASLAEREGLRGQVQCIYIDPPYGIRFNSNWQVSTRTPDFKDDRAEHISREPEQIKAFRDTWKEGVHSYLTYLRDRLFVARDLLAESGSIFVQIGDENVHRVRALLDEAFGDENIVALITATKTGGQTARFVAGVADYIIWYAKNAEVMKFRRPLQEKVFGSEGSDKYTLAESIVGERKPVSHFEDFDRNSHEFKIFKKDTLTSQKPPGSFPVRFRGKDFIPRGNFWKTHTLGMKRLDQASRLEPEGSRIAYVRYLDDYRAYELTNVWRDVGGIQSRSDPKIFVVQTNSRIVQRCVLMATDPGDLVLDPTCGSGTTAYVAEQWGRRWITIDTSRVALALARARIMGARYPYYLLADSEDGRRKEAEITGRVPAEGPTYHDIRQGFVYERVPHITLKSIANNAEIDVIWERTQPAVEVARHQLNAALQGHPELFKLETGGRSGKSIDFRKTDEVTLPSGESAPAGGFMEWEIPREPGTPWPEKDQALFSRQRPM